MVSIAQPVDRSISPKQSLRWYRGLDRGFGLHKPRRDVLPLCPDPLVGDLCSGSRAAPLSGDVVPICGHGKAAADSDEVR